MNALQIIGGCIEFTTKWQAYMKMILDCVCILGRGEDNCKAFDSFLISIHKGMV